MTDASESKPGLLETIKSRGHWRVEIRPMRFIPDRIERITDIYSLVEKLSVRFRGWDYPHVDSRTGPHIDKDWVGQEFAWEHYKEIWRLYQSAKFIHIFAIGEDWRDESSLWPPPRGWTPGRTLHALSALQTYTEIYEFAARLSLAVPGEDRFRVAVTLENLAGRSLWDEGGAIYFHPEHTAQIQNFDLAKEIDRAELVSKPRELGAKSAQELFRRFGWDASMEFLRSQQLERS